MPEGDPKSPKGKGAPAQAEKPCRWVGQGDLSEQLLMSRSVGWNILSDLGPLRILEAANKKFCMNSWLAKIRCIFLLPSCGA